MLSERIEFTDGYIDRDIHTGQMTVLGKEAHREYFRLTTLARKLQVKSELTQMEIESILFGQLIDLQKGY